MVRLSASAAPTWSAAYDVVPASTAGLPGRVRLHRERPLGRVHGRRPKDRLYAEAPASPRRRAVQTVLMNILEVLVRVHGTRPVVHHRRGVGVLPRRPSARAYEGREASVQLAGWPRRTRDFAPALPADAERARSATHRRRCWPSARRSPRRWRRPRNAEGHRQEPGGIAVTVTRAGGARWLDGRAPSTPSVFEELFIVAKVQFVEGDGDEITAAVAVGRGREVPALLELSASWAATRTIRTCASAAGTRWTPSRAGPSKWPLPRR